MKQKKQEGYTVRPLNAAEIAANYRVMQQDFAPAELKPLSMIRESADKGFYSCLGLFAEKEMRAYAYLLHSPAGTLLDYFAVCDAYRRRGIGRTFLKILQTALHGERCLLIEAEDPAAAPDAEKRLQCEQRIEFYRRCECVKTGVSACVFGVEYLLLELPVGGLHGAQAVREAYLQMYRRILGDEKTEQNVRIHG